ncbi:hypothetical protein MTO96_013257 [Rhipicephalus appendiculatus]
MPMTGLRSIYLRRRAPSRRERLEENAELEHQQQPQPPRRGAAGARSSGGPAATRFPASTRAQCRPRRANAFRFERRQTVLRSVKRASLGAVRQCAEQAAALSISSAQIRHHWPGRRRAAGRQAALPRL